MKTNRMILLATAISLAALLIGGCCAVSTVDPNTAADGTKLKTPDELLALTADDLKHGIGDFGEGRTYMTTHKDGKEVSSEEIGTWTETRREFFYIIDSSGSNKFREEVASEIWGHHKTRIDEEDYACVVQIASDSLSSDTRLWCRSPIKQHNCWMPKVKESGYENTREEAAYEEALTHLESELRICERTVEEEEAERRERNEAEIQEFLSGLRSTSNTDIEGAFYKALEVSKCPGCKKHYWVWSDMEEDPLHERDQPLEINLSGAEVHVRFIANKGEGYSSRAKTEWTTQLTGWGVAEDDIDWKNYSVGEFYKVARPTATASKSSGNRSSGRSSGSGSASASGSSATPPTASSSDPPPAAAAGSSGDTEQKPKYTRLRPRI